MSSGAWGGQIRFTIAADRQIHGTRHQLSLQKMLKLVVLPATLPSLQSKASLLRNSRQVNLRTTLPARLSVSTTCKVNQETQNKETKDSNNDMSTQRHDDLSIAPGAPVTASRPILTDDLDQYIDKPHVPRAYLAVSKEHPNGSAGHEHSGMSVMQQHVAFFDRNNDGVIYPWETYVGFRAIGFNVLWSVGGMLFINGGFSYTTLDGWIPSPTFPIYVKNIHKAKHGSDSEVYDAEGRFLPTKFEELFTKFDKKRKGGLNWEDLNAMVHAMANAADPFGWTAMRLEWGVTWLLLKDENGLVSKEKIRGMYDASIFEKIEAEITAKKGEAQAKKIK